MKDVDYFSNGYGLRARDCRWLNDAGLKETQWFLDSAWIIGHCTFKSFNEWLEAEKNK